ncbi:hypothetical protein [Rhodanobacter ginsengiterrae]|uniref:hypothetical protein n=1 Tax=Rhodanobacter ginsengiterrae TaxID=2008451 RepID=UPI003CF7A996
MNSLGGFLLTAVVIGLACWLGYRHYVGSRELLKAWARANGYTILHARRSLFMPLGMYFTTSRSQVVFHVAVYDTSRKRNRSAWVRLGTYWVGSLDGDAIDVRWENEG